jgi:hypothetical protein
MATKKINYIYKEKTLAKVTQVSDVAHGSPVCFAFKHGHTVRYNMSYGVTVHENKAKSVSFT